MENRIELHSEGVKGNKAAIEIKDYLSDKAEDLQEIKIFKSKNLGVGESILVAIIGQFAGHLIKKLIDVLLDKKKKEKEIQITVKFLSEKKIFVLPEETSEINEFIDKV